MNQKQLRIKNYVSKQLKLKREHSQQPNIRKYDVLKKYHKFIRDSDSQEQKQIAKSYGQQLAKQHYEQLFKQYALVDLTQFQTGKIGCRWRTQKEVLKEKGEKICANLKCNQIATNIYQMNFGYIQQGLKKNALVKVSVCKVCGGKLNYKKKLKQITEQDLSIKKNKKLQNNKDFNLQDVVKIEQKD